MSFKIIVDSCCDLTPSLLREPCYSSVPLTIRGGTRLSWMTPPLTRRSCCGG